VDRTLVSDQVRRRLPLRRLPDRRRRLANGFADERAGAIAGGRLRRSKSDIASAYPGLVRKRWFSPRAFLLHFEFGLLVVACLAAGWWQATRALGGNGLSWFYSVEWPAFAVVAVIGWWHLIHEDPEAYRARKERPPEWEADSSPGA